MAVRQRFITFDVANNEIEVVSCPRMLAFSDILFLELSFLTRSEKTSNRFLVNYDKIFDTLSIIFLLYAML